ncbi:gamma-glutamyl-gamma-aminobutyrate hydrolase family protein [Enterococcus sp. AZ109]|uniref:gamma-glutamyl-gamma-aminobutyrate hydrolase family protein n=1 Tax=Enterococcus sp. AZ109 TaxID=2774634 RepID=UPI003F291247
MKKIMYVGDAEENSFHVLNAFEKVMRDINAQMVISLDPKDIAAADGVLFPGDPVDVDPALYGEPNIACNSLNPERDAKKIVVLKEALKQEKPILAVCHGHQLVTAHFGGKIIQDIKGDEIAIHKVKENPIDQADLENLNVHESITIDGSVMNQVYGKNPVINSAHHQAVSKVPEGFKVTTLWFSKNVSEDERKEIIRKIDNGEEITGSSDVMIEAIEHESLPIISLQWHPEYLHWQPVEEAVDGLAIFKHFLSTL